MFYNVNTAKEYTALPKSYTFSNGSTTGNFDLMTENHVAEGFLPLELDKPTFTAGIQYLQFDSYEVLADKVIKHYIVVNVPLAELKSAKIQDIYDKRDSLLSNSTFTYSNTLFNLTKQAADDASQLQSLIGLTAQFPANFSWTAADGSEFPMTQVEFTQFANALASKKLTVIGIAKYHIAAVNALTVPLEVYNYDFSANW